MDFEFSTDQQQFINDVRAFLAEEAKKPYAKEVMSPDREADSMLADSPQRREFNKQLAKKRFLGMSWPLEFGGQAKEGIFEYLVNEELASVGAPLIGKGVGCVGKTLIRHGSEKTEGGVPAADPQRRHRVLSRLLRAGCRFRPRLAEAES